MEAEFKMHSRTKSEVKVHVVASQMELKFQVFLIKVKLAGLMFVMKNNIPKKEGRYQVSNWLKLSTHSELGK